MDNVPIVVCSFKVKKMTTGSGFVVTCVMGGTALLALSFLPKTLFQMNTIALSVSDTAPDEYDCSKYV